MQNRTMYSTKSKFKDKEIPDWKTTVAPLRQKALFWRNNWRECGSPTGVTADTDIAEIFADRYGTLYNCMRRFFKNIVVVLFFRTCLYTFPCSKYKLNKTFTLSKFTEAWQYSNRVSDVSHECQMSLHTEFHLPISVPVDIYTSD